jgi:hypothetical protein
MAVFVRRPEVCGTVRDGTASEIPFMTSLSSRDFAVAKIGSTTMARVHQFALLNPLWRSDGGIAGGGADVQFSRTGAKSGSLADTLHNGVGGFSRNASN